MKKNITFAARATLIVFAIVASVALFVLSTSASRASTYYVDANTGSDTNSGSQAQPFKTISKAAGAAVAGDLVLIGDGTYNESVVVPHSGTKDHPIVFQAINRLGVTVTGAGLDQAQTLFTGNGWTTFYITVRGIHFTNLKGAWYNGLVDCFTGWRVEDCLVDGDRSGEGVDLKGPGDDVTVLRTVITDIASNAMGDAIDHYVHNTTIQDCIFRRCNRYKGDVGNGSAGAKYVLSDGIYFRNLVDYDNVGNGVWLDINCKNFLFTGCTIFGNHSGDAIMIEEGNGTPPDSSPAGTGLIEGNLTYSNTGSGINIAETQYTTVRNNTSVDDGNAFRLRNMQGRSDKIDGVLYVHHNLHNTIEDNRFRAWRTIALTFDPFTTAELSTNKLDSDTYDSNTTKPFANQWNGHSLDLYPTLADVRSHFGVELHAVVAPVDFDSVHHPMVATTDSGGYQNSPIEQVGRSGEQFSIDTALGTAAEGSTVTIPVQGRDDVVQSGSGWTCNVYDLATRRTVQVSCPTPAIKSAVQSGVSRFAMWVPAYLTGRITKRTAYDIEVTAISVK